MAATKTTATTYWCELAWLGGEHAEPDVTIEVVGDRITSVTANSECPRRAVRLAGLTLPGLANAHSHAFHRALRGRTQVGPGTFWTWRDQMYAAAKKLQPDSYLRLATAVFGEMVLAGITSVGEFHYLHHDTDGALYADPNEMAVSLRTAAAEAGLRITLLDTCYLHGGLGPSGYGELNPVQRRFSDGDVEAWEVRANDALTLENEVCRVGAAIHSVRAVAPQEVAIVARWATERNKPLHAHVSEQVAENEQCVAAHGVTPVGLLAESGALQKSFTAVHATHLAGSDIGLLGGLQCTVCMCPTTERDLADGIGPASALRDEGAALALGTDSHAVIDLFEEAREVELHERLATRRRGNHDAASLLRAACGNGHRSLGWADAGELAPQRLADFITVRLDTVRTTGGNQRCALATAVFAAAAHDVQHVVVGGKVIVSDGHHVALDVAEELRAAITDLMDDQ